MTVRDVLRLVQDFHAEAATEEAAAKKALGEFSTYAITARHYRVVLGCIERHLATALEAEVHIQNALAAELHSEQRWASMRYPVTPCPQCGGDSWPGGPTDCATHLRIRAHA